MPNFTQPIAEVNDCHTPAGSPAGGQFCSFSKHEWQTTHHDSGGPKEKKICKTCGKRMTIGQIEATNRLLTAKRIAGYRRQAEKPLYDVPEVVGDTPYQSEVIALKRQANVLAAELKRMPAGRASTLQMKKQLDGLVEHIDRLEKRR